MSAFDPKRTSEAHLRRAAQWLLEGAACLNMDGMPLAEVTPMSSKSWHTSTLGARPLAPETLMMGYGYDPHLSERSLKPRCF